MKLKTLIIDDDSTSVSLLKDMLYYNCKCFVANNGQKGIDLFERAKKSGSPFEIVLLDIVMPGIGGIEVLKKLREIELSPEKKPGDGHKEEGEGRPALIIMQTSSEDPQDMLAAQYDGGCNGFITKPYSKAKILKEVLGQVD